MDVLINIIPVICDIWSKNRKIIMINLDSVFFLFKDKKGTIDEKLLNRHDPFWYRKGMFFPFVNISDEKLLEIFNLCLINKNTILSQTEDEIKNLINQKNETNHILVFFCYTKDYNNNNSANHSFYLECKLFDPELGNY